MTDYSAYRPSNQSEPKAINATLGVKFAQKIFILDPWGFALLFKTRWQRILFRLRHPIVYSKRGIIRLYRRIKSIFVKPKYYMCRVWMTREEFLNKFPGYKNGK